MSEILDRVYFSNTVQDYVISVGLILLGVIFQHYLAKLLSNLLFRLIQKYTEDVSNDRFFSLLQKPLSLLILLVLVYGATDRINYPEAWGLTPADEIGPIMVIHRIYLMVIVGSVTWIMTQIIEFMGVVLLEKAKKTDSRQDDQLIPFGVEVLKIVVVLFAIFFVMGSVFKVNVGSLIAGLGIGGLALALAAKESLENLLASFTIFFDSPFVVGDTVKVRGLVGTVDKVGFRSTRLRTPEKSYVTVPNKSMIDAELDNLSLRTFRRVDQTIGLVYGTPADKIKAIVDDIQTLVDDHEHTNQDGRIRFTEFGASSLDVMVRYYVDTMDWTVFLNVKQEINYKIMEIVEKRGSDFAFPSQTLYLEKNE